MKETTYRIDDIGASTKYYNQHGKTFGFFPLANFWFFKRVWPFKGWARYEELTAREWKKFLDVFERNKIIPIIAVTACWVEKDSSLTPFPVKFPEQAKILKEYFEQGKIIIANHGLTHCIVGKHLPLFWGSNRVFHREFLPSLDQTIHSEHIIRSQKILEDFFQKPIEILVPPGNLWSFKTSIALGGTNIKRVMCSTYMSDSNEKLGDVVFVPDRDGVVAFHDRELKLYGEKWLTGLIQENG